ncbi:transmembrane gamma-carboxyglutamic acid protein 4 isoform X4 [Chlorocebus sabaeus]|uniref:transmembrane gamma-carboxyglutamic acid protein 4 isoform X4 n=1 Tax=Chlorocebus sabaeus TaxID=60711 RepID=UPI0018B0A40B|nr:transmembrane gamma-carboxyglutamic acid protein 4 isoform X3 [Chlorocebus sabaeus]
MEIVLPLETPGKDFGDIPDLADHHWRTNVINYFLFDSCQTMFTFLVLLSQLPTATLGFPHCTRGPKASKHAGEEVFTSKEEANFFIRRRLLYNRFDLELFTPGDVERECNEELCNYEEAREIFVDEDKTIAFWQKYSAKGPTTKSDGNREKIDVMGLLTGLIAAGVFLVIFGLLGYYLCITKCNRLQHPQIQSRYHIALSCHVVPASLVCDNCLVSYLTFT